MFGLLTVFVVAWTAYGAVTGLSSAVHHDTAEAYVWGREFQLGYYKHPPLWAWMAGAWFTIAPHQDWAFRLLSMINAALGLWGSWRLIGDFAGGRTRVAATLLLLLTPCFTFLAYKFNANSIFLSVWPWTLHYFVRSFETRRISDALLFGVFMALALLSKYFAVILGVTCLLAASTQQDWRPYFMSLRPYLSAVTALIVLSPHIWWLFETGFLPFHYFDVETGRSYAPVIAHALGTIAAVVAFHIVVIAIAISCAAIAPKHWRRSVIELWRTPKGRMLMVLALAPIALTVALALIFRNKVSVNMLIGTVSLIPLLVSETVRAVEANLLRRAAFGAVAVTLVSLALSPAIAVAKIHFSHEPDVMQPRAEVAEVVTQLWRRSVHAPLRYIAGSEFYANATAFYSPDHPHVFIDFDECEAPWVTAERLANGGLMVICDDADASCHANAQRTATARTLKAHFMLAHSYAGVSKPAVHFTAFLTPPEFVRPFVRG
ncbi:MAG: glycosyltransferase family 39 protein [Proteobacteria bacterium]|nr:glycosyltransferase family 39 protein [Pseudomonadota bacterium]